MHNVIPVLLLDFTVVTCSSVAESSIAFVGYFYFHLNIVLGFIFKPHSDRIFVLSVFRIGFSQRENGFDCVS